MTDDHKLTEDSARWRKLADELAGALEPFARYQTPFIMNYPDDDGYPANSPHNVGAYRKARTALSSYRREAA